MVGAQLRIVYGGVALNLPANRARDLLALPGVVAVQRDGLAQPLTDSSPEFIGAPTLYDALGSDTTAGEGAIVGILDSGSWPEHPSYLDPGIAAPPSRGDGEARVCNFGDNPLTAASDPFVCNDKLISGEVFLDTYNAVVGWRCTRQRGTAMDTARIPRPPQAVRRSPMQSCSGSTAASST